MDPISADLKCGLSSNGWFKRDIEFDIGLLDYWIDYLEKSSVHCTFTWILHRHMDIIHLGYIAFVLWSTWSIYKRISCVQFNFSLLAPTSRCYFCIVCMLFATFCWCATFFYLVLAGFNWMSLFCLGGGMLSICFKHTWKHFNHFWKNLPWVFGSFLFFFFDERRLSRSVVSGQGERYWLCHSFVTGYLSLRQIGQVVTR